jgi:hypothetical protein
VDLKVGKLDELDAGALDSEAPGSLYGSGYVLDPIVS